MKLKIVAEHSALTKTYSPGQEQQFKTDMLRVKKGIHPTRTYFEVENEEKESGFPDTLEFFEDNHAELIEYKMSDADGVIEFQKGQPLFYKRNERLIIKIIAWCVPDQTCYIFDAKAVVAGKKRTFSIKGGYLS